MLKNKIVVVTGGGSGIGKSIAKLFSENNAIVCVTDKNLESAMKTAEECVNKSLFYKYSNGYGSIVSKLPIQFPSPLLIAATPSPII